jgi:hypothetical protein
VQSRRYTGIEDQILPFGHNARYTGDHRSIFRKRYAEMITRISPFGMLDDDYRAGCDIRTGCSGASALVELVSLLALVWLCITS